MGNIVIVGMQWGDEGKGKVVDLLCPGFDVVARFQGGHNAGHTVKYSDRHFALHLVPSGILHEGVDCVLGNGMVVPPDAFLQEVERLEEAGVEVEGRLHISDRAQVLLPVHVALDQAREEARGEEKIGTTSRGIGPAYESKVNRFGLRMCDLLADDLEERLRFLLDSVSPELRQLGRSPEEIWKETSECLADWRERLRPYITDTRKSLHAWMGAGKRILLEGAQGTLLDVDHGTYPYVTSSNSTVGGACTGTGLPPSSIDGVVGVLKAYTTRVGGGPFPGELADEVGERLRRRGNEFGTTTGRPRRCGWLDLVAARYSRQVNGIDAIALTKLDVLDSLEEIPVCVRYRLGDEELAELPGDWRIVHRIEAVYETLPGWQQETTGVLEYEKLPQAAKDYVAFIEKELHSTVVILSSGPRREETILRDVPIHREYLGDRWTEVLAHRG